MKKLVISFLMLATAAISYPQTFLFKYNTELNTSEFNQNTQRCFPVILGSSHVGVAIQSSEENTGLNQSRFIIFRTDRGQIGRHVLTIHGKDYGWYTPSIIASPTGSFLIGGEDFDGVDFTYAEDRLWSYNPRTKSWSLDPARGIGVIWSAADQGKNVPYAIWIEIKNEGGKLWLYVYRF